VLALRKDSNLTLASLAVPRRWDIGNITKFVLFIGPIGSIFDYVTYFTARFEADWPVGKKEGCRLRRGSL
jgi:hypothetical protein